MNYYNEMGMNRVCTLTRLTLSGMFSSDSCGLNQSTQIITISKAFVIKLGRFKFCAADVLSDLS